MDSFPQTEHMALNLSVMKVIKIKENIVAQVLTSLLV